MSNEWVHIDDWKESGYLNRETLEKWATIENAYLTDQDEDLLMYRSELVKPMYDLMLHPKCIRRNDLLKTLKNYSKQVFNKIKDLEAQDEFNKLKLIQSTSKWHLELIDHLEAIKSR